MMVMKVPVSARVDADLVAFLDGVRRDRGLASRSEALELAIRALREQSLEADYAAAMGAWYASDDVDAWDAVAGDGLGEAGAREGRAPDAPR